jgi:hypothetical protein
MTVHACFGPHSTPDSPISSFGEYMLEVFLETALDRYCATDRIFPGHFTGSTSSHGRYLPLPHCASNTTQARSGHQLECMSQQLSLPVVLLIASCNICGTRFTHARYATQLTKTREVTLPHHPCNSSVVVNCISPQPEACLQVYRRSPVCCMVPCRRTAYASEGRHPSRPTRPRLSRRLSIRSPYLRPLLRQQTRQIPLCKLQNVKV